MAEKKVKDGMTMSRSTDTTPLNYLGAILQFTAVEQGAADDQRIGDACTGTSLKFSLHAEPHISDPTTTPKIIPDSFQNLRVIVFIWKDDTDPTVEQIVDGIGVAPPNTSPLLPLNHDFKVKRKILEDTNLRAFCTITSNEDEVLTAGGWAAPVTYNRTFNLTKLKGGVNTIRFQGGTTTAVNHIYALLIAPHVDVTGTPSIHRCWDYWFNYRYTYIDM